MSSHKTVVVAIVCAVFILAILMAITLQQSPSMTSGVVIENKKDVKLCYDYAEEGLTPNADINDCCLALSNSAACQKYLSKEIVDDLYRCKSDHIIVVNKALIDFCTR